MLARYVSLWGKLILDEFLSVLAAAKEKVFHILLILLPFRSGKLELITLELLVRLLELSEQFIAS